MSTPRFGETFVHGQSSDLARELLQAADDAGVDQHLIRTTDGGFMVPDAVHEQLMLGWASADAVV